MSLKEVLSSLRIPVPSFGFRGQQLRCPVSSGVFIRDPSEAEMRRFHLSDLGLASVQALIDGDFVLYLVFSTEQSNSYKMVPGNENDVVLQASEHSGNAFWTGPEARSCAPHFLLLSNFLIQTRIILKI